jgi:hypothetical protein
MIIAVTRIEFIGDRMSYITLRGRWCDVIVLNVQAPPEDESDKVSHYPDGYYAICKNVAAVKCHLGRML